MSATTQDYFKTPEHDARVKSAIEREHTRLVQIGNTHGAFASISDALGSLTTHTSWFGMIGLHDVAIGILEDEVQRLKKQKRKG